MNYTFSFLSYNFKVNAQRSRNNHQKLTINFKCYLILLLLRYDGEVKLDAMRPNFGFHLKCKPNDGLINANNNIYNIQRSVSAHSLSYCYIYILLYTYKYPFFWLHYTYI